MGAFYQSEIVRLFPSGNVAGQLVTNVQSVATAIQYQRNDTMRLGRFAPGPRRQTNQDPVVNVTIEYIPTGSDVVRTLGLMGTGSALDNLFTGNSRLQDMKIQVREMVGGGGSVGTFNLRSGVLTNYAFQAAVGQTPRATFAFEFLDMGLDASTAVVPPSIDEDYPTVRPQDIDLTIPTGIIGIGSVYPQAFSITLPLGRTSINKIGSRKAIIRDVAAPVLASFQIQAIIETFQSTNGVSGNSAEMFGIACGKRIEGDIVVVLKQPSCTGVSSTALNTFTLKKPYLDSISYSNSVGGYTSVDMQLSIPVTPQIVSGESNLVIS